MVMLVYCISTVGTQYVQRPVKLFGQKIGLYLNNTILGWSEVSRLTADACRQI